MTKKVNPRAKIKTVAKSREAWGMIDYDDEFLNSLSEEELEYLAMFLEKHYQGPGTSRRKRANDCFTLKRAKDLPADQG